MSKRKSQRYWVETQAQDKSWTPVARAKRCVYVNCNRPRLERNAKKEVAFMRQVLQYAKKNGVGILGARVMQIDPNEVENLYHAEQIEG